MPVLESATAPTTLFTLESFKAWLRVQGIDPSQDDRLVIAADSASAELERETGRYFVKRVVTDTFDGDNKPKHALKFRPVVSPLTAFTMDGNPVDPSQYVVNTDTGIVTFLATSPWFAGFNLGIQNIVITYTAGFDLQDGPNLPGDIYRAALDQAKAIYDELTTGAIAATSVTLGGATMVVKAAKRPPSVQRVIDKWQDVRP